MSRAVRRAFEGIAIAIFAPVGWLLARITIGGRSPLEELASSPALYAYLLGFTALLAAVFGAISGHREDRLIAQNRRLDALAITDPVTGLKNSRYFRARLEEACARAERERQPIAVAVIDLDRFKSINDRYGHLTGDQVLCGVAAAIAKVVRRGETAARVGGEEFALILPGSDGAAAQLVAERVRRAVSGTSVQILGQDQRISVTASVGVASTSQLGHVPPDEIYSAADDALYRAKRGGRDRVASVPPVNAAVPRTA